MHYVLHVYIIITTRRSGSHLLKVQEKYQDATRGPSPRGVSGIRPPGTEHAASAICIILHAKVSDPGAPLLSRFSRTDLDRVLQLACNNFISLLSSITGPSAGCSNLHRIYIALGASLAGLLGEEYHSASDIIILFINTGRKSHTRQRSQRTLLKASFFYRGSRDKYLCISSRLCPSRLLSTLSKNGRKKGPSVVHLMEAGRMASLPPAPEGLDLTESRVAINNTIVGLMMGIATVFLALRIWARVSPVYRLGTDDWFTCVSLVSFPPAKFSLNSYQY